MKRAFICAPWTIEMPKHLTLGDTVPPMAGRELLLLPPEAVHECLPGTVLYSIFGNRAVVGKDNIDEDTRGGMTAWGILVEREP